MSFIPNFEKINALEKKLHFKESVKVQTKTDIDTESIKKILNLSALSCITNSQAVTDKINCNGKVVFYLCYQTQDDQIKKCEISADLFGDIDLNGVEAVKYTLRSAVEKTESDGSGVKLELSAYVVIKAVLSIANDTKALSGGENLVCDMRSYSIKRGCGSKRIVFPIEQEFELPYSVEEVVFHRAEPIITSAQCGVGCIIVDGEVRLSAILLQKDQKGGIIRENKVLPFKAEIEYDEAMPALSSCAVVELKSFKTDITVDEQMNKSLVNASVVLTFEGEAFTNDTLSLAVDAFCTTEHAKLEYQKVNLLEVMDMRSLSTKTQIIVNLSDNDSDKKLVVVGGERVEIVSTRLVEGGLSVTGTVGFTGYFINEDGKLSSKKLEAPFETLLEFNVENDCNLSLEVCCDIEQFREIDNGIELNVNLYFSIYPEAFSTLKVVKDIESNGEKEIEDSAISVYLPYKGEELWSLCKRLNQTPEQLVSTNTELEFPLTGSERIVVYRQK